MNLNNNWSRNVDTGKWTAANDVLQKTDFDALVQDVKSYRFYQKCLSGSTYVGVDSVIKGSSASSSIENIYDILNQPTTPNSYYFNNTLPYLQSLPLSLTFSQNPSFISSTTSLSQWTDKVLPDYNMTLKNLFTPERLINDQKENVFYVDLASTKPLTTLTGDLTGLVIDGVNVKENHRILIKDQFQFITIPTSTNPSLFFPGYYEIDTVTGTNTRYRVPTADNGIYLFKNKKLIRTSDLDTYEQLLRYSICVKLGDTNKEKQFKLKRLTNGFYPQYQISDPVYFEETHNFVLRQRVDYNNLYELSLNDTLKHATQSLVVETITGSVSATFSYTIPERTLTIGEFGVIINNQEGITNIINSKYKTTLRSITQTNRYYWICGDEGLLLKVDKIDFSITQVKLNFVSSNINHPSNSVLTSLTSIQFFNDLRGAVVGKYNQVWVTSDSGQTWEQIYLVDFDGYSYNKVLFTTIDKFYVGGDNGVFIEFSYNLGDWFAYKRRISKYVDGLDDEYLLVSNITDMNYFIDNSGFTTGTRDFIAIGCQLNNLFIYDISNSYSATWSFIAIEDGSTGQNTFGDISSITYVGGGYADLTFTTFNGVYLVSPFSGTFSVGTNSNIVNPYITQAFTQSAINKIFNYNDSELDITGNFSLWKKTDLMSPFVDVYDPTYFGRLKPRLLFMDYDIGSKLYWFDDYGQYRIPERYGITVSYLQGSGTNSSIAFNKNTNTYFDGSSTQSYFESNWITYWKDRSKTFEYYSNLDQPHVVEPSFTFSSSNAVGRTFSYATTSVTTSYNEIINLMPTAVPPMQEPSLTQSSRFRDFAIGVPLTSPTNNYGLYFYDYLGVWNVPQMMSYTASIQGFPRYKIQHGNPPQLIPIVTLNSVTIDSITYSLGSLDLFLGTTQQQALQTALTVQNAMNSLGFGNIFIVTVSGGYFNFSTICTQYQINSLSGYNNSGNTSRIYTNTFNSINCSGPYPEIGDVLHISSDVFDGNFVINRIYSTSSYINQTPASCTITINPTTLASYAALPDFTLQVFYPSYPTSITGTFSGTSSMTTVLNSIATEINNNTSTTGFSAVVSGGSITIFSPLVNPTSYNGTSCKLELSATHLASIISSTPFINGSQLLNLEHYCYFYTDFNQNILNNIPNSNTGFTVRDLNKYPLQNTIDNNQYFVDNFNTHYISYSYDCELVDDSTLGTQSFRVYPKYSQYSAYYNLEATVEVLDINSNLYSDEIRYAIGFLNFGYSPTYNLLSYLNFLNPTEYTPSKEFFASPNYIGIPGPQLLPNNPLDRITIDSSGTDTNKIGLGENLKYIWDSFLKWTFVDVNVTDNSSNVLSTQRLLIIDKYFDPNFISTGLGCYVIEFHDKFLYFALNVYYFDILSRRSLKQISDDLQYANNIHRPEWLVSESYDTGRNVSGTYSNWENNNIDFKFPTDSYVKILLSDYSVIRDLSGIIYTDYKYELAMQVTKLDRKYQFQPSNVSINGSNYQLDFPEKHLLNNNDYVIISPIGTQSSYPTTMFGYHNITYVNDYSILLPITSVGLFGPPNFVVSYVKKDYFFNFQPIDIFDLGIGDKLIKQSVEVKVENWDVFGSTYSLFNLDLNKYKYRLIDGLDLVTLNANFSWILEAEISNAIIGLDSNKNLVWYDGIWYCGRWFGGNWISGDWLSGDWYSGNWTSKAITDNLLSVKIDNRNTNTYDSIWYGGRWFDGNWENGTWYDGRWYGGTHSNGLWYKGTWNDGLWQNGQFQAGIWVLGQWNNGIFNQDNGSSYWLDGKFYGGDFENGTWYNGIFDQKNGNISRFGTKSINTKNSIWKSGKFLGGQFHSYLNLDDAGNPDVSEVHKYSKWYTGLFGGGDFYGGISYNINFKNTVWHGGISEDIEVLSIFTASNSINLNGEFEFNVNDEIYIVDNMNSGTFSAFGSTVNPIKYKVLRVNYDTTTDITTVNTDIDLSSISSTISGTASNLRCVSNFQNSTWNSGIWNNGVFIDGTFNGGIWYNGYFSGTWG